MAQGRQNTNYAIDLYACHPFFIQGFSTMTNGENARLLCPIREYLMSRGVSRLHRILLRAIPRCLCIFCTTFIPDLGLSIEAYKHIITPLAG